MRQKYCIFVKTKLLSVKICRTENTMLSGVENYDTPVNKIVLTETWEECHHFPIVLKDVSCVQKTEIIGIKYFYGMNKNNLCEGENFRLTVNLFRNRPILILIHTYF